MRCSGHCSRLLKRPHLFPPVCMLLRPDSFTAAGHRHILDAADACGVLWLSWRLPRDHSCMTESAHELQCCRLRIVGVRPAGLTPAEAACTAGARVDLGDAMGSVGRKYLLAGKDRLNRTQREPPAPFAGRYGNRRGTVARWLQT